MKRSSTILALVVVAAFSGAGAFLYHRTQRLRTWRELVSFQGQELARDPQQVERAALLLERHLQSRAEPCTWPQFAPFFVLPVDSRVLVFQCATASTMNSEPAPSGRIFVFDLDGDLLSSERFSFGWSFYPRSPRVFHDSLLESDVLEFSGHLRSGPIGREFYVLRDDQLDLIRLEDADGVLIQNRYNGRSAGRVDVTAQRMEWLLSGSEAGGILASLVLLGGKHWTPEEVPSSQPPEVGDRALHIARFRQDPEIRKRVSELSKRDHPWIREAARLASTMLSK